MNETTNETIGASYIRLDFSISGTKNDTLVDVYDEYANVWVDYWEQEKGKYENDGTLSIVYYGDASWGPETDRVVNENLPVFTLAVYIMLIYLTITLGKFNCVDARPLIALGSLLSTICAIVIALGLAGVFGYDFNVIVLIVPLLLLGVGVDDDIIIVESLNRTPLPGNDVSKEDIRFGHAMAQSGLSVSLTSFSSIVAFAIGSAADLPGIQSFCMHASLSFLGNYGMCIFDHYIHFVLQSLKL